MKKLFLIGVFLLSIFSVYAQTGERYFEYVGNFSICPPENWMIQEIPGYKYQFFIGPSENGFAQNINCIDESYDGALSEYVDLSVQMFETYFTDVILGEKESFQTDSGLAGYKAVITYTMGEIRATIAQYYFSNNSQKYVLTCTVGGETLGDLECLFDQCAKTFEIIE
jgi:hypothetical protein